MGNKSTKKVGSDIYTGTATVGKVEADIGAIIGTVFAILLIGGGWLVMRRGRSYREVSATVTTSNCTPDTLAKSKGKCTIQVSYTVSDKNYKQTVSTKGQAYSVGDTLKIQYDPKDPSEIRLNGKGGTGPPYKAIGIGMIVFGLIILVVSWAQVYLTKRYKPFAAAAGAADIVGAISGAVTGPPPMPMPTASF